MVYMFLGVREFLSSSVSTLLEFHDLQYTCTYMVYMFLGVREFLSSSVSTLLEVGGMAFRLTLHDKMQGRIFSSTIYETPFSKLLNLGSTHPCSHCGTMLHRGEEESFMFS